MSALMSHGPIIAVTQLRLETLWEGFEQKVLELLRAAMQAEAQMVVFPEWVCLGLLPPGGRELFETAAHQHETLSARHEEVFSAAAGRIGVAVVAGTVPAMHDDALRMVCRVYGPAGDLLHTQAKLHPSPLEQRLGLQPGTVLAPLRDFPVKGVHTGFLMGRDSRMPEAARALALEGANLLVEGLFSNRPYNSVERFHGVHVRCFENQTMGAKSVLLAKLGDQDFRGNAKVLNLSFCTPFRDGVVAEASTTTQDELVIGEPDRAALRAERRRFNLLKNINHEYVRQHFPPPPPPVCPHHHAVTVASAQLALKFSTSPENFRQRMTKVVEKAARAGAELLVLPEDTGTCLLGLYLDPVGLGKAWGGTLESLKNLLKKPPAHPVSALFAGVSPYAHEVYLETFSALSRKFSLNILAGSILLRHEEGVVNTAHLFDKSGDLVLTQDKIHLFSLEKDWGLQAGHNARVVEIPLGGQAVKVGVMVCMDTGYPEMGRILTAQGAQVLLDVTANPDECYTLENLNGLWARVQDNAVFGIKSCLYGDVPGLKLRGRSGIYAPCPMTDDRTGILTEAAYTDGPALASASLDFDALGAFQTGHHAEFAVNWNVLGPKLSAVYEKEPAR